MKKKYRYILVILFLLLTSFPYVLFSQNTDSTFKNTFDESPLHLGFELGSTVPFDKHEIYANIAFFGYLDVNIFKKVAYLKIEAGVLNLKNSEDKSSPYISIGLNYDLSRFKKNKFYFHIGLAITKGFPFFVSSFKYVFRLEEQTGISIGLKYPFGSSKNPFISSGIQLFIN